MRAKIDWSQPAPDLTAAHETALLCWAQVEREDSDDHEMRLLYVVGAMRNAERRAASYGLVLVAEMARRGILGPGEDPVSALDRWKPWQPTDASGETGEGEDA